MNNVQIYASGLKVWLIVDDMYTAVENIAAIYVISILTHGQFDDMGKSRSLAS